MAIRPEEKEEEHSWEEFQAFSAWVKKTYSAVSWEYLALVTPGWNKNNWQKAPPGGKHWWDLKIYQPFVDAGKPGVKTEAEVVEAGGAYYRWLVAIYGQEAADTIAPQGKTSVHYKYWVKQGSPDPGVLELEPEEEDELAQAQMTQLGIQKIGNQYLTSDGSVFGTLNEAVQYAQSLIYPITPTPPTISRYEIETRDGEQVLVTYDAQGNIIDIQSLGAAPSGVGALSPQDQALATTKRIFKNQQGQYVNEYGKVIGNSPEEAEAWWDNQQEFERFLSERLTPYQQEQLALQKEQLRLGQKPSLGEITQAKVWEQQQWMNKYAAPIPWETRWASRAGQPSPQSATMNPQIGVSWAGGR